MNHTLVQQKITSLLHPLIESFDGRVGISARHLEKNWHFDWNAEERFPMASTYKVAIATHCLKLAEQNTIQLNELIPIQPTDVRPGSGMIFTRLNAPGIALSIENLIRLMIEVSDNTATDLLLKLTGGPQAVFQFLLKNNITGMRIDRDFLTVLAQQMGIKHLPEKCTAQEYIDLEKSIDPVIQEECKLNFLTDDQDTTTPVAMRTLLEKIVRADIIHRASADFLLSCMGRCRTGLNRIRAGIPQAIWVGQKTGSMTGVTNDVAIIKMPDKTTFIMTIFLKQSTLSLERQEKLIADIASQLFHSQTL